MRLASIFAHLSLWYYSALYLHSKWYTWIWMKLHSDEIDAWFPVSPAVVICVHGNTLHTFTTQNVLCCPQHFCEHCANILDRAELHKEKKLPTIENVHTCSACLAWYEMPPFRKRARWHWAKYFWSFLANKGKWRYMWTISVFVLEWGQGS